jgi:ABC-type polysaccharide/polyol phosphate export permease
MNKFSFHVKVMHSLAVRDLKNSYKRTKLGPLWGVITSGVMVLSLWMVFGYLFTEKGYFGYMASGILLWSFVSGALSAAGSTFIASESLIRSLALPAWVYIGRSLEKTMLIFLHSLPLVPISIVLTGGALTLEVIWFIPGLALVFLNITWISGLIAFAGTRYRDLNPVVSSIVLVMFYLTPLFWRPDILHPTIRELFLSWNLFNSFINLLREPWLGSCPGQEYWIGASVCAFVGWSIFLLVYRRFNHRIPFWL